MNAARRTRRVCALLLLPWLGWACQSYHAGPPLPAVVEELNATLQPDVLVLQPGDQLEIRNFGDASYNQTTVIRPDGRASFLELDQLEVAGMTLEQLEEELEQRYAEVGLTHTDFVLRTGGLSPRTLVIFGAVNGGGSIPVAPGLTVEFVEALARAGGPLKTFAVLEHTILIRWMPELEERRSWIIDARRMHWEHAKPLFLQANDIVYVPRHPINTATDWIRESLRLIPLPFQFLF